MILSLGEAVTNSTSRAAPAAQYTNPRLDRDIAAFSAEPFREVTRN
jgi:hypothetical protein